MTRNERIAKQATEVQEALWRKSTYREVEVGGFKLQTRIAILDSKALAEMERALTAITSEVLKP